MDQTYQRHYSTVAATRTATSKEPSQMASNVDHETLRFLLEAPKIKGEKVTIKVRNVKDNTDEEVTVWAYPKDKIADTNATYEKHALIFSFSNARARLSPIEKRKWMVKTIQEHENIKTEVDKFSLVGLGRTMMIVVFKEADQATHIHTNDDAHNDDDDVDDDDDDDDDVSDAAATDDDDDDDAPMKMLIMMMVMSVMLLLMMMMMMTHDSHTHSAGPKGSASLHTDDNDDDDDDDDDDDNDEDDDDDGDGDDENRRR
ncbi:hypothetical protein CBR_g29598 [Chara braunii]|uniref:Uncharacterized protein n=1 Tax=Chara braunii TaxID=69332 RepID=A0A388LB91_CHABU|nr:hypothetical protein CBR_g29598 [Chara braunii]|eukprot:GBG79452.1 hypothetical protein CBR_g29598 [Chara braunii]